MKKILFFLCATLAVHFYGQSQSFNPAWAARFQEVLDSVRTAEGAMGATAAVLAPGEGIWSGISGNSMPGVPLTSEMRFGIGSNTKLFTAVVMLKLQEEGALSLDDHLYQWLPMYPNINGSITIRQLLSHQSGIFNHTDNPDFWPAVLADTSHFWTPQEILGYVLPPYFEPGNGWAYSNTNYLLASMIIDSASGMTWLQKVHEVIFDPLDMDSTFFGAYESPNGPIAGTQCWGGIGPWFDYPVTSLFSAVGPAGGILSTANEMSQWYNELIGGEILSDYSMQQILDFEAASHFGLAVVGDADKSLRYPWYNHGGWMLGYVSQIVYDLRTRSVLCFIKNEEPTETINFIYPLMSVLYNEYPQKQNDAGIIQIISPGEHLCINTVVPQVILKNFGSDPLTSVSIQCKLDEVAAGASPWSGYLGPGDSILVSLGSITPGSGFHTITVFTSAPNYTTDGYSYNDTISAHFVSSLLPSSIFPLYEDFEDPAFPPEDWISGPDVFPQWGRTTLTANLGDACAVRCNWWDDNHPGALYNLDLPAIDLSSISNAFLSFTYAYARNPNTSNDTLGVFVSSDCGSTWQTIFYKGGYDLKTANWHQAPFFPENDEWKTEVIPLEVYNGQVIIRFQDICRNGNNLFLDDVKVDYPEGTKDHTPRSNTLNVYPNPSSEEITIKSPPSGYLSILNLTGQEILHQAITASTTTIDISTLPSGIYVVKVFGEKGVQLGKVIKQ